MNMPVWYFDGRAGRADMLGQLVQQFAVAMREISGSASADPMERLEAEMTSASSRYILDPRLERLFPPTSDDEEEAAEFRKHAITQQAADRLAAAHTVLDCLDKAEDDEVLVGEEQIDAWVKTLSGLRASWHVELTGSTERMAEPHLQDLEQKQAVAAVCDWLGYLVEEALQSRATLRGEEA